MKPIIPFLLFGFLVASFPSSAFSATATCRSDGKTDVTSCLQAALISANQHGDTQLYLQHGRYLVSLPIVIPDRTQLIGVGPGDGTTAGTAIAASNTFPLHGVVVMMGWQNKTNFGVQVTNLTIDGGNRADFNLQNLFSMEQSYGAHLTLVNYLHAGLDIETSSAQNSGPFVDLLVTPGTGATVTTDTNCVIVRDVIAFRGISGLSCDAGTGYATRPAVALELDGQGTFTGLHVAHFATAAVLGSTATSADGMVVMNANFGPDVDTGIMIDGQNPDQNLSIFGVSCSSCLTVLNDTITLRTSSASVGWYLMGNGSGPYKKILSSDQSITDILGNYQPW